MRVVGWVPVPKARPGSRRIILRAWAGGSCQVGTIQNSGVISTGANCDCVKRTQSWSSSSAKPKTWHPSKKSWANSKAEASSAKALSANSAVMRERCQPSLGAGMPGSPNKATSASVCASASSTLTLKASSASSASLSDSTRSCGHISMSSNIDSPSACAVPASVLDSGYWFHRP